MDSGKSHRITRGRDRVAVPGAARSGLDLEGLFSWMACFSDPVLIADNRKRIGFLNQAATDLLGYHLALGDEERGGVERQHDNQP